ncbi:MAG: TauD/TfdA family dioxygenase [Hyphomicrobiaceae bacterium]
MRIGKLPGYESAPVLVTPERTGEATLDGLLAWAAENRATLDAELQSVGAILFRGFEIDGPEDLAKASAAFGGQLRNYVGGDSPRSQVAEKIYNSTDFPAHLPIGLHNELSYGGWWPSRIFFHCVSEPTAGGETPIGDSREIYRRMPETLRDRFERQGVCYVQNLRGGDGAGKSWQQTFETEDHSVVEAYCHKHGMEFHWTDYGLRTSIKRQGVLQHPKAGTKAWFNQAEHFHAAADPARFWDAGSAKDETLPAHCTYGDGSEITKDELEAVIEVRDACEVAFPWQKGDLTMLDNLSCAHGRRPFEGPRKILVSMS